MGCEATARRAAPCLDRCALRGARADRLSGDVDADHAGPPKPRIGERVAITVLTFSLTRSLCWTTRPRRRFRMRSGTRVGGSPTNWSCDFWPPGPGGSEFRVPLSQRPQDGAYWDGELIFPSSG